MDTSQFFYMSSNSFKWIKGCQLNFCGLKGMGMVVKTPEGERRRSRGGELSRLSEKIWAGQAGMR